MSYPASGDRKWANSVEASLPIVNWQTVAEDSHLEMLDHGVHHLPEKPRHAAWIQAYIKIVWSVCVFKKYCLSVWLPVDPARTFIRLDVHLVQIDVDLGDFHLEAVGQKLDGLPKGAIARPLWQREKDFGFSRCSNVSYNSKYQK